MIVRKTSTKTRLLCGAATGLAFLAGGSALAQDEASDEIVVTGIRSSIESSLDEKKKAAGIVEAISSEDIGKLPDLSIADALARLPGVTAQRVRGRSQQVSIRGLGPDFSLALLNGREVVSAGNNRGIEFDQFPSELIAQGVVYKSANATLAATGIAGSVDLRTIKPLNFKDRKINLSATGVLSGNGKLNPDFSDLGYRFFGSYIDQNDDGTIGWALGVTHQSNPTQFFSRELKTANGQVGLDANGLYYPADNPRQGVVSREFERTSITGALQFEPNDRFQFSVDAFYTDTKDSGIFRGTETPIASWANGVNFDGAVGAGPFAEAAQYSGVWPILRTDTEGNTAEIFAIGGNTSYQFTDRLSFMVDYGFSTLDRSDIDYESYAGTAFGIGNGTNPGPRDTLLFRFPSNGEYSIGHTLDYTDSNTVLLTDPGGWGQVGFIKRPQIDDELHQLRAETNYAIDAGPIANVKLGYLLTSREKNFDSNEDFIRQSALFSGGELAIPAGSIIGSTNSGTIGMDIIAYDPSSFLTDGTYLLTPANDVEWTVDEKINTGYLMLDIATQLGEVPVTGNAGFQYVRTNQSSIGTIAGGINDVTAKYDNWLPSANLAFEVMPDTFLRLAFAKTITRARLDQIAANQNFSLNNMSCVDTDSDTLPDVLNVFDPAAGRVCFSFGGGNPQLRPYKATSYDVSFEKYFSRTSALAVALFYKDLSDWVVDFNTLFDATQQINALGANAFLAANPEVALARISGPVNFSGGSIKGVEATLRVDFRDFTDFLDGFGSSFSYTYADGEVDNPRGGTVDIPGYSKTTWAGDLYYEKNGLQAKLSARHRGPFLSEIQNFDGSLSGADAQGETILDGQIGYRWDKGALSGFGIQFEVFNITDEPFVTQNDLFLNRDTTMPVVGTFPSRHEQYGRTFNLTIKKEF